MLHSDFGMELSEQTAFVEQVQRQHSRCIRVARIILSREDDARDAVQESILKAWQHRHRLREEAAFSGWLVRIVVNECRQRLRRARKVVFERIEDAPARSELAAWNRLQDETPEARVVKVELEELLRETVLAIPQNLREPLMLFYFSGLSGKQVAIRLGITGAAVKIRLARGRMEVWRRLSSRIAPSAAEIGDGVLMAPLSHTA
ncbi:MAG: sigma-70 family RNA polymerase sigma factor [Acidobacteria bacterium]|nr:sigma-70 family RNA polymerase sigma factor [Acidobacteriota bacterium]